MSILKGNSLYNITAVGEEVTKKQLQAALAPLGLCIAEQFVSQSINQALSALPREYPGFGKKLYEFVTGADAEYFDSDQVYLNSDQHLHFEQDIRLIDSDDVQDVAEKMLDSQLRFLPRYEAEMAVCHLLQGYQQWLEDKS